MKKSSNDSQIPVRMTCRKYINQRHCDIDKSQCQKVFLRLRNQKAIFNFILEIRYFSQLISILGFQQGVVCVDLQFLLGDINLIHFTILLKLNIYYNLQYTLSKVFMEGEQLAQLRQQKQAYICQNIDQNLYEDFYDFCTSYAGLIDIDSWDLSYVYEVVAKFKDYMKQKEEKQQKHQKSFAIYQTTTVENIIGGSASDLQINSVLQTLDQNQKTQQEQKKIPSPSVNKKNPEAEIKNNQNPKPFAKKQGQINEKLAKNQLSPLQLLNCAIQIGQKKEANRQQKAQKLNNSFFDSINFWQVPKIQQDGKKSNGQAKNTVSEAQSPKNEHKTMRLNLNANQLNANSKKNTPTSIKKIQQPANNKNGSNKKVQQNKPGSGKKTQAPIYPVKSQVETFNYSNQPANFDNFFNMNGLKSTIKPSDFESQFDTFSMIAEQQIKKKKSNTICISPSVGQSEMRKKAGSTIQLKQVRQLNTSTLKQPYKGSKVFQKQFTDHVSCIKTAIRPQFSIQNLKVQLKSHQIVQRSIFSSNYIMYNMHISPLGIICKRNYEDFTKLKSTLQKFYPGIQMPYLQKEGWRSDTSSERAKKQGQMLELFLADVLKNPQLKNSRVTEQFLTLQDHKKMKRKFEQYEKMIKFKSIQELCLLNGKVQISLTQKHRIYNEGMAKLVVKIENNIQKYRKNCQILSGYYSQAMQTMLAIDDTLKQMQKDIEDFNRTVTINEIQNLQKNIKKIRETYKQNYFRTKFQRNIIEQNILLFLKYQKQNTHASKQIIDITNNLTSRYLKRMETQNSQSVDSSYLSKAFNEHKQGILEQSKNITVLKYQAGFLQAQASTQLQRIMHNLGDKIDNLWKQIGKKYLDELAKSVNVYSSII